MKRRVSADNIYKYAVAKKKKKKPFVRIKIYYIIEIFAVRVRFRCFASHVKDAHCKSIPSTNIQIFFFGNIRIFEYEYF